MVSLQRVLTFCLASAAAAQSSNVVEVPVSLSSETYLDIGSVGASAAVVGVSGNSSSLDIGQAPSTSAQLRAAVAGSNLETRAVSPSELPIFFFHGLTGDAKDGANIAARLRAAGRTIHVLDFCEGECSKIALNTQVPLATAQIRSIIAKDAESFADGYIFIGHSQGGALGRAVIQEMDDHNALMFISLAGVLNGLFYGPQTADATAIQSFTSFFAPATIPTTVFDTSRYSADQCRGQLQHDFNDVLAGAPELGDQLSIANLWRSPNRTPWLSWNPWLPVLNNINSCTDTQCEEAKARRKNNFLKLKALHSFMSPRDGAVAPWQSSHFAQYNDLSDASKILADYEQMTIVPMEQTMEYADDTYGLRTLHSTGRLHLREVANVHHNCWIWDETFTDTNEPCSFDAVFDTYVYPLLTSTVKLGRSSCAGCQ